MDKEEQQEELQDAFAEFAAEYPQSALVLITGLFVGLLEYSVELQGGDSGKEIRIDGCGKRDITLHAKPSNAALRGDSGIIAGVTLESTVMQQEVAK
jgi:hypothetical protein